MVILTYRPIQDFTDVHPEAKVVMDEWFEKCENESWATFNQMKKIFNSVDAVANSRYIFNVGGNKYRIVAMIHFSTRTIYIKWVGSHSQYDRIDAGTINDY